MIWQVGTNAVLRNLDPAETARQVEEGVGRIQAAGADLVLVDPQYSPAVTRTRENANRMVQLLGKVAALRHVGFFPRFEVMREWHEEQSLPFDSFRDRRRPAHERLGLRLLRAVARRRHHQLGRPDQARHQRAGHRADLPADATPVSRARCGILHAASQNRDPG